MAHAPRRTCVDTRVRKLCVTYLMRPKSNALLARPGPRFTSGSSAQLCSRHLVGQRYTEGRYCRRTVENRAAFRSPVARLPRESWRSRSRGRTRSAEEVWHGQLSQNEADGPAQAGWLSDWKGSYEMPFAQAVRSDRNALESRCVGRIEIVMSRPTFIGCRRGTCGESIASGRCGSTSSSQSAPLAPRNAAEAHVRSTSRSDVT